MRGHTTARWVDLDTGTLSPAELRIDATLRFINLTIEEDEPSLERGSPKECGIKTPRMNDWNAAYEM